MSLEREYARALVRYTKGVTAICYEYLPLMVDEALANGITADRMDNWITDVTEKIRQAIDSKLRITDKINAMFNKVKGYAQRQQEKIYRSIFGGTPARPSSHQYEVIKQIWASQNLTLIRSIDNRTLEAIHYALSRNVIRTVDREMLVSELTQTIKHMANVNEKRAALIACDQVGKLNSQLAQYEQFNQGVDSYIWTTMKDNRVRPQHAAREGKRYYWNDPPSDGHPGWPIRCRCIATPVYDTDKMPVQPKRNSYTQVDKNGIINAGGVSGALDPLSPRAEAHAARYYVSVRAMKTDVSRIAKNTGMPEADVKNIKDYVFFEVHDLGAEGFKRFDPSYYMAESWRRLIDGRDIQPHDLLMLKHELLERELVKSGVSQREAHRQVSKKYDYGREATKYHARISKRKKD